MRAFVSLIDKRIQSKFASFLILKYVDYHRFIPAPARKARFPTRRLGTWRFLTKNDAPVIVLGKLRELRVVEIADMAGAASHAQDLGEFSNLLKLEEGTSAEAVLRIKMAIRRIWLFRPVCHNTLVRMCARLKTEGCD